jgi:hypothetical protein
MIKKWIKENPDKHIKKMLKINKNPDKIRKTAEAHRGLKRSDESRRKMSIAAKTKQGGVQNKGKKYYRNPNDLDAKGGYFVEGTQPVGWVNKVKL